MKECPVCNGTKKEICNSCKGSREENCSTCDGDGFIIDSSDADFKSYKQRECPTCEGDKVIGPCEDCDDGYSEDDCVVCNKNGEVEDDFEAEE